MPYLAIGAVRRPHDELSPLKIQVGGLRPPISARAMHRDQTEHLLRAAIVESPEAPPSPFPTTRGRLRWPEVSPLRCGDDWMRRLLHRPEVVRSIFASIHIASRLRAIKARQGPRTI